MSLPEPAAARRRPLRPVLRAALGLMPFLLLPAASHAIVAGDTAPPPFVNGRLLYRPDSPDKPYVRSRQAGRLDTQGVQSPFSGVGSINGGTGTLIDSIHVLTAAHLFGQGFPDTGATFVLDTGRGTLSFPSSRVSVHPQFQGIGSSDLYDIAIVTLSAPVPREFHTYGLYDGPLVPGTTLTLVGYGRTGDGVNGYAGSATNPRTYGGGRRVGQNNVDAYLLPDGTLTQTFGTDNPTYEFDFDGHDAGTNVFGPATPNNLTLGNDVETTVGTGDSGGPAFVIVNGQYQIAALNNFVDKYGTVESPGPDYGFFGSGGGGAIISAYSGFITSVVGHYHRSRR